MAVARQDDRKEVMEEVGHGVLLQGLEGRFKTQVMAQGRERGAPLLGTTKKQTAHKGSIEGYLKITKRLKKQTEAPL